MAWQFNPYAIPLFISSIFLTIIAVVAYHRSTRIAVNLFIIFVISVAGLNLAYAMELLSADLATMMIWLRIEYIFRYIPTLWLFFVLAYTGHEKWIKPRYMIPLFAVPALWAFFAWTNEAHLLNWATVGTEVINGYALFMRTYGVAFYVGLIYDYTVAIIAITIMLVSIFRSPSLYRGQIKWLVLAVAPPLIGSILTTLNWTPIRHLDLLPFGYALTCLPLGWSLFRHQLLDIMPRAYSQVIQSIPDAVLVLDETRRLIHLNPAGARLVRQRQPDDQIGQTLESVFPQCADDLHRLIDATPPLTELHLATETTSFCFEPRLSQLVDGRGRLRGYVIVLRDITERKRAEETINRYAAELEARNKELDAFSYTVAHDLKSPITSIIGYSQFLLEEGKGTFDNDFARKNLSRIRESGYKMNEMIDGLLVLAQLIDTSTQLTMVNMEATAQAAVERYRLDIDSRGIQVQVENHLPPACGHAVWLEEVFANLLGNAIKYIGQSNPEPRITIRAVPVGEDWVRYEVQDNGVGISKSNQGKLFEMFTRFHANDANGLGLGLSIVLRIVQKLGGRVGVNSEPGEGSTFWFTLPAAGPLLAK